MRRDRFPLSITKEGLDIAFQFDQLKQSVEAQEEAKANEDRAIQRQIAAQARREAETRNRIKQALKSYDTILTQLLNEFGAAVWGRDTDAARPRKPAYTVKHDRPEEWSVAGRAERPLYLERDAPQTWQCYNGACRTYVVKARTNSTGAIDSFWVGILESRLRSTAIDVTEEYAVAVEIGATERRIGEALIRTYELCCQSEGEANLVAAGYTRIGLRYIGQ